MLKRYMAVLMLAGASSTGLGLPMAVQANDGECSVCGTELNPSSNLFTITKANGTTQSYGCPGCGLYVLSNLADRDTATIEAQDFLSRKPVDARQAWYVRGSSVSFCCQPSWLAFGKREQAESFVKGFGGELLDFEQAFARASAEDHAHMLGE